MKPVWFALGPLLCLATVVGFTPDLSGSAGLPVSASPDRAAWVAGLTLWLACWWFTEPIPIPATSLLPVAALPLMGVLGAREVSRAYMDHLIMLFLGGFLLALAMERWGLHLRLARGILRRSRGSRRRLILSFMVVTALISMWISNTATTLMMLPVALAAIEITGRESARNRSGVASINLGDEGGVASIQTFTATDPALRQFSCALVLGVAYAANLGGMGTPVGTPPNLIFQKVYAQLSGQSVSFLEWMSYGVPAVVITVPLAWWVLVTVGVPVKDVDTGPSAGTDGNTAQGKHPATGDAVPELRAGPAAGTAGITTDPPGEGAPMSTAERWVLGIFLSTSVLWMTRSDIGDLRGWASRLGLGDRVEDSTVAIGAALLLFSIPVRTATSWRPLLTWSEAARVPWGSLLLLGAGFALSDAFQASGLSHWIGANLVPDHRPTNTPLFFLSTLLTILVVITLLTEFASNTACAAILLPVLYGVSQPLGYTPDQTLLMMVIATLACSNGFVAPAGTAPNAIAYATGCVPVRSFFRAGIWIDLVGILALMVIATLALAVQGTLFPR